MNKRIGVFLSSKDQLPESYRKAALQVGELIGRKGMTLVYGGARKGLMEILAQSCKQHGGRVYGVIPDIIVERNLVSDAPDITFRCVDLNDRKAIMNRESDLLIALPGGIGTLDEVFTVMAAGTIGIRCQPVVFYNVDGCWDSLLRTIEDLMAQGLVSGTPADYYSVATNLEELEALIG